jgi:hypothetical protein
LGALVLGVVLIIGYYYQSKHPISRLELVRSSGYHIYFKAGFSGFVLFTISALIWVVIDYFDMPSNLVESYGLNKSLIILNDTDRWEEVKIVLIFALMFILSFIYVKASSLFYYCNANLRFDAINKKANDLERLIIASTATIKPLRLDLDCGKVYVGLAEYPNLEGGELAYLTMLPLLSGRRNEQQEIEFSNNYYRHYNRQLPEDEREGINWENAYDFKVVLPVKDIVLASNFDPKAFMEIRSDNESQLLTKSNSHSKKPE